MWITEENINLIIAVASAIAGTISVIQFFKKERNLKWFWIILVCFVVAAFWALRYYNIKIEPKKESPPIIRMDRDTIGSGSSCYSYLRPAALIESYVDYSRIQIRKYDARNNAFQMVVYLKPYNEISWADRVRYSYERDPSDVPIQTIWFRKCVQEKYDSWRENKSKFAYISKIKMLGSDAVMTLGPSLQTRSDFNYYTCFSEKHYISFSFFAKRELVQKCPTLIDDIISSVTLCK